MGTMVDPSLREHYSLFELKTLVKKYEDIQNKINMLECDFRVSDFSSLQKYSKEELDLEQLRIRRSKVFSLTKLRQTIISGVHCANQELNGDQIGRRFNNLDFEVIKEQPEEELNT